MAPTKKSAVTNVTTSTEAPIETSAPVIADAAPSSSSSVVTATNEKKRGGRKPKVASEVPSASTTAPVVTESPAPAAVIEQPASESTASVPEESAKPAVTYQTVLQTLKEVQSQSSKAIQVAIADVKVLQAQQLKENRRNRGKKPRSAEKAVSGRVKNVGGFQKPVAVHIDLLKFMGLPEGSLVSRTEASKFLYNYVNTHNLKLPNKGRFICPDETIVKLLKLPNNEPYDSFGSQKLFNHLFPLSRKALAAAALLNSTPTAAA